MKWALVAATLVAVPALAHAQDRIPVTFGEHETTGEGGVSACDVVWDDVVPAAAIPGRLPGTGEDAWDLTTGQDLASDEPAVHRPLPDDGRIHVSAQHVRAGQGKVVATGDIVFVGPNIAACAQRAEYDISSATLSLTDGVRARVEIQDVTVRVWANEAHLNTNTLAGELLGTAVLGPGIRFTGGRVQRNEDGTLLAEEVYLTPCECGPDAKPSWDVAAVRMKVFNSGRASFTHGRLRIKGIPVFFAPFGIVPLTSDRITGVLLPSISRPGNDDYELQFPIFIAPARTWDLSITPIYNLDRGFKLSNQGRYAIRNGKGAVGVVLGQDQKVVDETAAQFGDRALAIERYGGLRWYGATRFEQDLPDDFVLRANVNLASDDRWSFDFDSNDYDRSRLEFESNTFVHRGGDWLSWTVASTYFQDQRSTRIQREFAAGGSFGNPFGAYESTRTVSLPLRARVSGPLVPIDLPFLGDHVALAAGGDLAYDLALNVSSPREGFTLGPTRFPGETAEDVPPRQANRLTFEPLVALPMAFAHGGISVLTQAGARAEAARTLAGTSATRLLPFVSSDARVQFGRTFKTRTGRLRHTIYPEVSAQYVPASFFDGAENVGSVFGPDAPEEGWTLRTSLVNTVLSRQIDADGRRGPAAQVLSVRLGHRYSSTSDQVGALFATVRAGYRGFSLRTNFVTDPDLQFVDTANVFLGTGSKTGWGGVGATYSFGRIRNVDQISATGWLVPGRLFTLDGGLGRALSRLRLEATGAFDLNQPDPTQQQIISIGGGLSYVSPCECWALSVGITQSRSREKPSFVFRFEPRVPRSARSIQPLVAGEER